MTELPFSWTFPYRPLDRAALEPVIPMRLHVPGHTADLVVLVDTGAERTLLDGVYLRTAGIDIFSGEAVQFQGFMGASMTAYIHPARLIVADFEIETGIAFSAQRMSRQILGRDVLYHFLLGLRDRALEVYLGPEAE